MTVPANAGPAATTLAQKTAHLLDAPLTADTIESWTQHYARPRAEADRATASALIFRIGAEWLALPTDRFDEVAPESPVHTLPHRRGRARSGLVGVRGEIIVHVSLADLLEIDAADPVPEPSSRASSTKVKAAPRLLVTTGAEGRLAFTVNEIGGVRQYDPAELRAPPSTLERAKIAYTRAMIAHEGRVVGLLDADRVFRALSAALA